MRDTVLHQGASTGLGCGRKVSRTSRLPVVASLSARLPGAASWPGNEPQLVQAAAFVAVATPAGPTMQAASIRRGWSRTARSQTVCMVGKGQGLGASTGIGTISCLAMPAGSPTACRQGVLRHPARAQPDAHLRPSERKSRALLLWGLPVSLHCDVAADPPPVTPQVLVNAITPERRTGGNEVSALASISHVYVSNDLQVVKVYVTIYSDDLGKRRALENLRKLAG